MISNEHHMQGERTSARSREESFLRCMLLIATTIVVACTTLSAQDSTRPGILIGIGGGAEFGWDATRFPIYSTGSGCGEFTAGTSRAYSFGGTLAFPALFGSDIGLTTHASWESRSGYLARNPNSPLVVSEEGEIKYAEHEYRFNFDAESVRLDLLGDYSLSDRFMLRIGPWFAYRFSAGLSQIDYITDDTYRFDSSNRETSMDSLGVGLTPWTLAFGASAGIAFRIPLSAKVTAVPEVFGRAQLSSVAHEAAWQIFSGGVRIGVLVDLRRSQPVAPPPAVAAPVVDARRPSRLSASIDLYGIDEGDNRLSAATVNINEVLYRSHANLLRPVYFDSGAATISDRYIRYNRAQTEWITADSLGDLSSRDLSGQALNLLGLRLRDEPSTTLSLTGSVSHGEPRSLALERAEHVRRYLSDVWGIDISRITVGAAPASHHRARSGEDAAEERRVTITSGSPLMLKPLMIDHLSRSYEPPLIALDPHYEAEAGMKKWTILLKYNGREVGRFSSDDSTGGSGASLNWQLTEGETQAMNTYLAAELMVEDSSGGVVTTTARVPLRFERNLRIVDREEKEGSGERITFSLFPFGETSARLTERNKRALDEAAAAAGRGSRITIIAYTGFLPDKEDDQHLARIRAEEVAWALRSSLKERGLNDVTITIDYIPTPATHPDTTLPESQRRVFRQTDIIVEG